MDRLIELDDVMLCPAEVNHGFYNADKYNYGIKDELDGTISLPIFASPMDSVIDKNNWSVFNKAGIKPILPRTEELGIRLEGCEYLFVAFSIKEVIDNFINQRKQGQNQFKICIENSENGHDSEIFNIALQLRKIYGNQINIMAGNIGNAKTYLDYCKAGIDYVRVGLGTGSLVNQDKYGFYYPLASLLIDVIGIKNTVCMGLKQTKIIADGGISSPVDILKCMALGADYVMCGRMFIKTVEASGTVYKKTRHPETGKEFVEEVTQNMLSSLKGSDLNSAGLQRLYCGNSTYEIQSALEGYLKVEDWMKETKGLKLSDSRTEWVKVNTTLDRLMKDIFNCFTYGFTMADATDWKTFKSNIKYCRIQ